MKVSELIRALSDMDPEADVYVDGYEDGLEDLSDIKDVRVMRDLCDSTKFWWAGPHDIDSKGTKGVLLPRPSRP